MRGRSLGYSLLEIISIRMRTLKQVIRGKIRVHRSFLAAQMPDKQVVLAITPAVGETELEFSSKFKVACQNN
jgi:hypothetical protein